LRSAIHILAKHHPELTENTGEKTTKIALQFLRYNHRTKFLLELDEGENHLKDFINNYKKRIHYYHCRNPKQPVIVVFDNDKGANGIVQLIRNEKKITCDEVRDSVFVHWFENLYIVFVPRKNRIPIDIEGLFDDETRLRKHKGLCFNTIPNRNEEKDLSKSSFAKHIVSAQRTTIDFSSFEPLLNSLKEAIQHYRSIST
jgi:hypothetical protein